MKALLTSLAALYTLVGLPVMLLQVSCGFVLYLVGKAIGHADMRRYGKNMALAADQNANVLWLGAPDETISSRCGRALASGRPKWYIGLVLAPFVDWAARRFGDGPDHCLRAIEGPLAREGEVWSWQKK